MGYRLEKLTGTFDIIFVDANKDGYESYVKTILDKKLLAPNGIILCDNGTSPPPPYFNPHHNPTTDQHANVVFARGLTIGEDINPHLESSKREYWLACGKALDHFNRYVASDDRVDVTMLPVFDGVSQIKWKVERGENGVGEGANGHGAANGRVNGGFF